MFKSFITKVDEKFENQSASIRNLEKQVGQIANQISERTPGTLPSDTVRNPKYLKAVTLRSGKMLSENCQSPKEKSRESQVETKESHEIMKGKDKSEVDRDIKHMSPLPFSQKMKQEKLDKCFGKFLEMLKQLYVNIPFTGVVTQMSAYAKFLKEILSSKRKLEKTSVVKLNARCSVILQNKLPQKCGDPGSFTIRCAIGNVRFEKSLSDSGASINLMPLSIFKKLEGELGIIKSIPVSLQLADQSTIIHEGIIEDVLVRVDKFVLLVDFIVVDMEENKEVPLILGRPFLATGRAILDVYEGQLMLRVGEEKVVFNMKKMMKFPQEEENFYSCFKVDILTDLAEEYKNENLMEESLERCITESNNEEARFSSNCFNLSYRRTGKEADIYVEKIQEGYRVVYCRYPSIMYAQNPVGGK
ncbi:uncharacterized protein LOC125877468 [Solanum stenotomum]|uniref:uncharacterized protein LOC125877468 n=1 Tax=Solanum stenotomum TaxID=172797 RepID=UPI0020D0A657|nr:uncharacterized protein LOC125877468 [Solanum stenotomum]